jgi:hypothetical protein
VIARIPRGCLPSTESHSWRNLGHASRCSWRSFPCCISRSASSRIRNFDGPSSPEPTEPSASASPFAWSTAITISPRRRRHRPGPRAWEPGFEVVSNGSRRRAAARSAQRHQQPSSLTIHPRTRRSGGGRVAPYRTPSERWVTSKSTRPRAGRWPIRRSGSRVPRPSTRYRGTKLVVMGDSLSHDSGASPLATQTWRTRR